MCQLRKYKGEWHPLQAGYGFPFELESPARGQVSSHGGALGSPRRKGQQVTSENRRVEDTNWPLVEWLV